MRRLLPILVALLCAISSCEMLPVAAGQVPQITSTWTTNGQLWFRATFPPTPLWAAWDSSTDLVHWVSCTSTQLYPGNGGSSMFLPLTGASGFLRVVFLPYPPTNLLAYALPGTNVISLTWADGAPSNSFVPTKGYYISRKDCTNCPMSVIGTNNEPFERSWWDAGVPPATTRWYVVQAFD